MTRPVLYIGNKNYSSWSMRPWLALKWGGIAFYEKIIPLGGEGYGRSEIKEVRAVSPSGRAPALHVGDTVIYESLAICEWAAEQTPSLWPADALTRAEARAASSEMHAGFFALREAMSCNIRRRLDREQEWRGAVRVDLAQLFDLWQRLLGKHGGPFLFGQRGITDATYAPVCTRLRTYKVTIPDFAQAYCERFSLMRRSASGSAPAKLNLGLSNKRKRFTDDKIFFRRCGRHGSCCVRR